ncbi:MAG: hypothetical protein U1F68_14965 [Gammaproteobacteria bacterium]
MSTIDDDRERFERWINRVEGGDVALDRDDEPGDVMTGYRSPDVDLAWLAWQAALRLERNKPSETTP